MMSIVATSDSSFQVAPQGQGAIRTAGEACHADTVHAKCQGVQHLDQAIISPGHNVLHMTYQTQKNNAEMLPLDR